MNGASRVVRVTSASCSVASAAGSAWLPGAQKRDRLRRMYQLLRSSKNASMAREASMALTKSRQTGGVSTLLDLRQAEQLVYTAAQTIPGIEQEIEQIDVPNVSARLVSPSDREFQPCGVLALGDAIRGTVDLNGQTYQATWTAGKDLQSVAVLTPAQAP